MYVKRPAAVIKPTENPADRGPAPISFPTPLGFVVGVAVEAPRVAVEATLCVVRTVDAGAPAEEGAATMPAVGPCSITDCMLPARNLSGTFFEIAVGAARLIDRVPAAH